MSDDVWQWDDVRAEVKPREDVVPICLDGTIQRRLEQARKALRDAQRASGDTLDSGLADLRAEVEHLEAAAQAATRDFTIRAIPHVRWRELVLAHPSDDPGERYDAAKFVPAAIAACCPHFTGPEQVAAAAEDPDHGLTTGQITKLFTMARLLNEGDDRVPFVRSG